jgi:phage-related minor tail protein
LIGQEYEAYQKLRDEAAMDAWIEQHELQYDLLSNTVDIVTEGFATMIEEGKSFNETMKDIWKDWVAMAIREVQRLIAELITAFIIKKLIQAADIATGGTGGAADVVGLVAGAKSYGGTGGAADAIGLVTGAKSYGGTGAGGLILGGGGSEVSLLVNELRQMRREMLGALTAPVTMNWRKGEMHRAVAEDGLYRRVI